MNESLVAINVYKEENGNVILLNNSPIPYLYYFNGENDLLTDILENDSFKRFIEDTCFNIKTYAKAKISYFYFKDNQYVENSISIQDNYLLKNMNSDEIDFFKYYLWEHFNFLYESAYHDKYNVDMKIFDPEESILDIYDKIQTKYPKRVIKSTVINYIRSELIKTDLLNNENTNYIIMKLETLLNQRN